MSHYRSLDALQVAGRRVLVRADLNVPMQDGRVTDPTRIVRFAPTVRKLAKAGAQVIIVSHFGRPEGKFDANLSLVQLVATLSSAIGLPVKFASDCVGPIAEQAVGNLRDGEVLLLENVRFHKGEEANDPVFAQQLAVLGDLFVNDAFSVSHRAHASTTQLGELLPCAAGLLMGEELDALEKALDKPERPLMAIVGGAKISTKLALLHNLLSKVDVLVIGGAMANTFLAAEGRALGRSLTEPDLYDTAREILAAAKELGKRIVLPVDVAIAPSIDAGHGAAVGIEAVPNDQMALDIGPRTIALITGDLAKAKTVVWNGPLGAFEHKPFDLGTVAVGVAIAKRTEAGDLVSIAGGGDTVAALEMAGLTDKMTYVSAAGGAFLEWLEGKELPGVAVLAT